MNDSRFKFLVLASCLTIIAVVSIWRFSNPALYKYNDGTTSKLGRYVHVAYEAQQLRNGRYDSGRIGKITIHSSGKCKNLNHSKVVRSERKQISELEQQEYEICSNCVSDKDYEKLLKYISSID